MQVVRYREWWQWKRMTLFLGFRFPFFCWKKGKSCWFFRDSFFQHILFSFAFCSFLSFYFERRRIEPSSSNHPPPHLYVILSLSLIPLSLSPSLSHTHTKHFFPEKDANCSTSFGMTDIPNFWPHFWSEIFLPPFFSLSLPLPIEYYCWWCRLFR